MTTEECLAFLREHQPMPPTSELNESLAQQYDEVRLHLMSHPDVRCLPLLLNSFGKGDGHGIYQLVEDLILQFPEDAVVPEILVGLRNRSGSVGSWCAEIAQNYSSPKLVEPLLELLRNGDVDERLAAGYALENQLTAELVGKLETLHADEEDEDVRFVLRHLIDRGLASSP